MPATVPESLRTFFEENDRPALAFSGGVDSSYLLYAAMECGAKVVPYFVKTQFQTDYELERAERLAKELGIELHIILRNILSDAEVRENPEDRCYHCKKNILQSVIGCAREDKRHPVIDATNATDPEDDRPGMRALKELGIISPLRLCGIGKPEIRRLSQLAGLDTWNIPSNSCLATRIPFGTPITEKDLSRTEEAEEELRALGFEDFRVRTTADGARLETTETQKILLDSERASVEEILLKYYPAVTYGIRKPGL